MTALPAVLILCTGNSARSQMAEGLLRRLVGDKFEVLSAGSDPKGVNPLAIKAMAEIDVDISGQRSKHLREYLGVRPIQHVIVVCSSADESCPRVWPGALTRTSHFFDDPAAATGTEEERLQKFREVRDQLHEFLVLWVFDQGITAR
jgi:arsenate reductase